MLIKDLNSTIGKSSFLLNIIAIKEKGGCVFIRRQFRLFALKFLMYLRESSNRKANGEASVKDTNLQAEHLIPFQLILLSVCLSALITLLIVGYHIQKVMKQNPAEILAKE